MKKLPAGQFKQTCLRILDEVRETREPVVITKRGEPVAQLVPLPPESTDDWAGALRGTASIVGDLVEPAVSEDDWKVLSD